MSSPIMIGSQADSQKIKDRLSLTKKGLTEGNMVPVADTIFNDCLYYGNHDMLLVLPDGRVTKVPTAGGKPLVLTEHVKCDKGDYIVRVCGIDGLPDPIPGKRLIVSGMVLKAMTELGLDASGYRSPGPQKRTEGGQVQYATGLIKI